MDQPTITRTPIGLYLIDRPTFSDERGFFREPVRIRELEKEINEDFEVVQMNHARSEKNILRGIHIAPWNKLIYVPRGRVQSVLVDLRLGSPTYGQYESYILGDENKTAIFVPKGYGNSYLVLSDEADYIYLTDMEWAPGLEKSLAWNDPKLGIKWESSSPILSDKDKSNPTLQELHQA